MTTFNWTNGVSGDWNTAADWTPTSGPPDASGATAIIAATGSYTVTIKNGETETVNTVTLASAGADLSVAVGGTLILAGADPSIMVSAGTFDLADTLIGGTVKADGGTLAIGGNITLEGVTWQGPLALGANANLNILGGLTVQTASGGLPGTIDATAGGASLFVSDGETLNNMTLALGSAGGDILFNYNPAGGTVTLGASSTITQSGGYNDLLNEFPGDAIVAAGAINITGGDLAVLFNDFVNSGKIQVSGGGIADLSNTTLINSGTLTVGSAGDVLLGTIASDAGAMTITAGGTMEFTQSASANVTFAGIGGELVLDQNSGYLGTIAAFSPGDTIFLPALAFSGTTSPKLLTGNKLNVVENGKTVTLQLNPAQTFSAQSFYLSSDSGGTEVTLPAPVISETLVSDSGASSTDGITNDDALTGTANPNAVVTLTEGATLLGTTTANASGVWSFTPASPPQGSNTIVASVTATAGNIGTASLTFTYDTIAPAVTETLVSDTGSSSTDKITKNDAVTGTGDANAVVTLTEGATLLGSTTASASGVWSFTPASLPQGGNTVVASETDVAGNTGTASLTFTYDTVAPAVKETLVSDTGASPTDGITKDDALTGIGDANTAVTLTEGATLLGTTTANASGVWSFTPPSLSQGSNTVVASETDVAGNTGTASLTFTYDTVPPAVTESLVKDTGASSTDAITNNDALTGSGNPNAVVTLTEGATVLGTTTANASGGWIFAPASLPQGANTIVASETDVAGNTGTASLTFTYDTVAPVVTEDLVIDTGASSTDGITNNDALTGTGAPRAVVTFTDGATLLGTTTANAAGGWYFASASLPQGANTVVASETDIAGNTGTASVTFTYDTLPPVVTEALVSDTGASASDEITNDDALTGTGIANAVVTLTKGATLLGTTTANAAGGWSFTPGLLPQGANTVVASETDIAGNIGTASLTFTYDTIAPVITEALVSTNGGSAANAITNDDALTGTGAPNAVVTLTEGATLLGTTTANAAGLWSLTPASLPLGASTVVASETDVAGNTGTASLTFTFINHSTDIIIERNGALSARTVIDPASGATNTLVLQGSGVFELATPGVLSNIQTVDLVGAAAGQGQLVEMRNGLDVTVNVLDSANVSIYGAADDDVINLGSSNATVYLGSNAEAVHGGTGNDVYEVTAATANATIAGGSGTNWLKVTGGGTLTMGSGITGVTHVLLDNSASYDFTANATQGLRIYAGTGADAVTVDSGSQSVLGSSGALAVTATTANAGAVVTAGTGVAVLHIINSGTVTLSNADRAVVQLTTFNTVMLPIDNGATIQGSAQGADTFVAKNNVLRAGETIMASGIGNTLIAEGAGAFDLRAPSQLTGIQTLDLEGALAGQAQFVWLRAGGNLTVNTMDAANIHLQGNADNDVINLGSGVATVTVGGPGETINGGTGNATYCVTSATAGATIRAGSGANVLEAQNGGTVALGAVSGIQKAFLNTAATAYDFIADPGAANMAIYVSVNGADTVVVGAASQSVYGYNGHLTIDATAANAGAFVRTGSGGATLDITTGGTAALNAEDTNLTVQLSAATNLTLGALGFITASGAAGASSTIVAGGAHQTLESIGGHDTLVSAASFGDTFLGTSAGLSGSTIQGFGESDLIDLTDMNFAKLHPLAFKTTTDALTVTDGVHSATLTMAGNYTLESFTSATDGHTGTFIKFV